MLSPKILYTADKNAGSSSYFLQSHFIRLWSLHVPEFRINHSIIYEMNSQKSLLRIEFIACLRSSKPTKLVVLLVLDSRDGIFCV